MTDRESDEDLFVDQLVRDYVERSTAAGDSTRLVHRVLAAHSAAENSGSELAAPDVSIRTSIIGSSRSFRWLRAACWWGMSSLALLLAFLYGRHFSDHTANASTVLRDVQSEHARGIDFCYRVRFDPDPRYWNPDNTLEGPSLSHLWTRGDRFWSECSIGSLKFKLGREAGGTIWLSPSREKGIRFSNRIEELPEVVAQICRINSMSVPRLLNEVLVDFDVSSRVAADSTGEERAVVWAQLKPHRKHPLLSHALLEIDPRTNVLVRLVLWTVQDEKPKGTVAFTLLERATLGDEEYELDSHLAPDAKIEIQTLPAPDYKLELDSPETR